MASTDDLVFGHGHDTALNAVAAEVRTCKFRRDLLVALAALIALDDHYKLTQSDDYVLVAPRYTMWLLRTLNILDLDIADRMAGEGGLRLAELYDVMVSRSFEVEVVKAGNPPPFMVGRVFRVRVMNAVQALQLPAMLTVRADNKPIELPVKNVNDL